MVGHELIFDSGHGDSKQISGTNVCVPLFLLVAAPLKMVFPQKGSLCFPGERIAPEADCTRGTNSLTWWFSEPSVSFNALTC